MAGPNIDTGCERGNSLVVCHGYALLIVDIENVNVIWINVMLFKFYYGGQSLSYSSSKALETYTNGFNVLQLRVVYFLCATGARRSILISLLKPQNRKRIMSLRNDIMRFWFWGYMHNGYGRQATSCADSEIFVRGGRTLTTFFFFLITGGRIQIPLKTPLKWRFTGVPMMAQHRMLA